MLFTASMIVVCIIVVGEHLKMTSSSFLVLVQIKCHIMFHRRIANCSNFALMASSEFTLIISYRYIKCPPLDLEVLVTSRIG